VKWKKAPGFVSKVQIGICLPNELRREWDAISQNQLWARFAKKSGNGRARAPRAVIDNKDSQGNSRTDTHEEGLSRRFITKQSNKSKLALVGSLTKHWKTSSFGEDKSMALRADVVTARELSFPGPQRKHSRGHCRPPKGFGK